MRARTVPELLDLLLINRSVHYTLAALLRCTLLCVAVLLCTTAGLFAQQKFRVSGLVREHGTNEPLELVMVRVDKMAIGTYTDAQGKFTLQLAPGNYTLRILYTGYVEITRNVRVNNADVTGIVLSLRSRDIEVKGVTITPKDNPAHRVIRNVIKNKRYNRMDRFEAYEYTAYSKLIVSLDNIRREDLDKPLLRNAKQYIIAYGRDTTFRDSLEMRSLKDSASHYAPPDTTTRYKVPLFMNEAVTRVAYRSPNKRKELIMAARGSGIKEIDVSFLNSLFQAPNVYRNNISILGKEFVSPVADGAFMNYEYQLRTIQKLPDGDTLYHVELFPLRAYDKAFRGMLYISQRDWAIKACYLRMNTRPDINFVENIAIRQEFTKLGDQWVISVNDAVVDLENILGNEKGAKGRVAVSYSNYSLNNPRPDSYFANETIEIAEGARDKDTSYWRENQKLPMTGEERLMKQIVDTLRQETIWKIYNLGIDFVMGGTYKTKYVQIGPYGKVVGFNPIEGLRTQVGLYTTYAFHPRLSLGGHLAYGFKDTRTKYELDVGYTLQKRPRIEVGFTHTHDIEQTGFKSFSLEGTGLINSVLMRVPLRQLNYYTRNQFRFYTDITKGLAATFTVTTKRFDPAFFVQFAPTPTPEQPDTARYSTYQTAEVGATFRISFREPYLLRGGQKVYLYSHFPQLYIEAAAGFKGFMGGQYNYQSLAITLTNNYKVGRFGKIRFIATAGQIFGNMPFPSLYVYRGSQTFAFDPIGRVSDLAASITGRINRTAMYDPMGFNLMYFYEFVADKYIVAGFDHRLEGWLLKKLPLIRRLQLREIITFRLGWGTLQPRNLEINLAREQRVKAPDGLPYMEAGLGIENIFKFARVDFVWRINYQNPDAPPPLDRFNYNFGLRFNARVGF